MGFKPVLVIDSDRHACETIRANAIPPRRYTDGWLVECADVRSLDYTDIGAIDLLSAGAPCQPFSPGGLHLGSDDHRNMFDEVIRAVDVVRPKAFVLENVRGLLFERNKPYFDFLTAQLRFPSWNPRRFRSRDNFVAKASKQPLDLHEYRVSWQLMNAADFGAPQHRVRLVIVGMRSDSPEWQWPTGRFSREALVRALHQDRYWDHHRVSVRKRNEVRRTLPPRPRHVEGTSRWRTVRDLQRTIGEPLRGSSPADPWHVVVPGARLYAKHTGSRLDWPSKTVKAGVHGTPGGEHVVVDGRGVHRYFTVRECAALQGLPRDYALPEWRSVAMRQIGNAVPVPLAQALGDGLASVLGGSNGTSRASKR